MLYKLIDKEKSTNLPNIGRIFAPYQTPRIFKLSFVRYISLMKLLMKYLFEFLYEKIVAKLKQ